MVFLRNLVLLSEFLLVLLARIFINVSLSEMYTNARAFRRSYRVQCDIHTTTLLTR